MSDQYRVQRMIACRILTLAGWIEGTMHLPQGGTLLAFLGRGEPLFRLTETWLPGEHAPHPFFALQRDAVIAVSPISITEPLDATVGPPAITRRISWLLGSGGVIEGTLELAERMRVSDYLTTHSGFVPMRDCRVMLPPTARGRFDETNVTLLALQSNRAIGVTEVDAS